MNKISNSTQHYYLGDSSGIGVFKEKFKCFIDCVEFYNFILDKQQYKGNLMIYKMARDKDGSEISKIV